MPGILYHLAFAEEVYRYKKSYNFDTKRNNFTRIKNFLDYLLFRNSNFLQFKPAKNSVSIVVFGTVYRTNLLRVKNTKGHFVYDSDCILLSKSDCNTTKDKYHLPLSKKVSNLLSYLLLVIILITFLILPYITIINFILLALIELTLALIIHYINLPYKALALVRLYLRTNNNMPYACELESREIVFKSRFQKYVKLIITVFTYSL